MKLTWLGGHGAPEVHALPLTDCLLPQLLDDARGCLALLSVVCGLGGAGRALNEALGIAASLPSSVDGHALVLAVVLGQSLNDQQSVNAVLLQSLVADV